MVRRDVPKDDIVRKVPEKRNAGIDEYRDPRDGQPLDESFAEELLDGVPATHVDMLKALLGKARSNIRWRARHGMHDGIGRSGCERTAAED